MCLMNRDPENIEMPVNPNTKSISFAVTIFHEYFRDCRTYGGHFQPAFRLRRDELASEDGIRAAGPRSVESMAQTKTRWRLVG